MNIELEQMNNKKYKASSNFICRNIAGSTVLISVGANIANFNGYIELNESAAAIWNMLQEPCDQNVLVNQMVETYEIPEEAAKADVTEFLGMLLEHQMVEVL